MRAVLHGTLGLLLLSGMPMWAQHVRPGLPADLVLEVAIQDDKIALYEPLVLTYTLTNPTNQPIFGVAPTSGVARLRISITHPDGDSVKFTGPLINVAIAPRAIEPIASPQKSSLR